MQINITAEYTEVEVEHNGAKSKKLVNLSELLDELATHRATNFGMLPKDTRFVESRGNNVIVGMEFPKMQRTITYDTRGRDNQTFQNASLPSGVLFVKLVKEAGEYRVGQSYIFAVRGKRIQFDSDKLYHYPMPNVYPDGKVCWGNVDLGKIKKLSAVEGMVSSFFANNFNNDLFYYDRKTTEVCPFHRSTTVPDFFKGLTQHDFSDDWLVEHQNCVREITQVLLR